MRSMPLLILAALAGPASAETFALHCGRLFDSRTAQMLGPHTLVISGDRIVDVRAGAGFVVEGVTFTGGVPTIWTMYLSYLEERNLEPTSLKRVVIGGSADPRAHRGSGSSPP